MSSAVKTNRDGTWEAPTAQHGPPAAEASRETSGPSLESYPQELPVAYWVEGRYPGFGGMKVHQWGRELDPYVPLAELDTPAVSVEIFYSDADSPGSIGVFELVMPPRSARALAAHLRREARVAEAADALEWTTDEVAPLDFRVRLASQPPRRASGRGNRPGRRGSSRKQRGAQ